MIDFDLALKEVLKKRKVREILENFALTIRKFCIAGTSEHIKTAEFLRHTTFRFHSICNDLMTSEEVERIVKMTIEDILKSRIGKIN